MKKDKAKAVVLLCENKVKVD